MICRIVPMPNIDDLIYRLNELEVATTFDLVEGYNQVEMKEEHKSLCAFATDWGLTKRDDVLTHQCSRDISAYDERDARGRGVTAK